MGELLHFADCDGADPCSCDRAGLPLTTGEGNTAGKYAYDSDKWWPAGLPEWIGSQTNETLLALDKGLRSFGWPAYNVPQPLPREDSWPGVALGLAQLIRESEAECGRLRGQLEAARQALKKIDDGTWNVGTGKNLTAREFARAGLAAATPQEES